MSIRELFLGGQSSKLMSTQMHSDEVESNMIAPSVRFSGRTHRADRTATNLAVDGARKMKCVLDI